MHKGLSLLQASITMNVADPMQHCSLVYCYVASDISQMLKALPPWKHWLRYMLWIRCNITIDLMLYHVRHVGSDPLQVIKGWRDNLQLSIVITLRTRCKYRCRCNKFEVLPLTFRPVVFHIFLCIWIFVLHGVWRPKCIRNAPDSSGGLNESRLWLRLGRSMWVRPDWYSLSVKQ